MHAIHTPIFKLKYAIMKLICQYSIFILMFAVLTTGCSKGHVSPDEVADSLSVGYMPAVKGMQLTYRGTGGEILTGDVVNAYDSAGFRVAVQHWNVAGLQYDFLGRYNSESTVIVKDTRSHYYATLQLIASQPNVTALSNKINPFIVTLPHRDAVGTIPCQETQVAEYHFLISDGSDHSVEIDFIGTYHKGTIDTLENVTVPAGTFRCLKVHYTGTLVFNTNEGQPKPPVQLDFTEWYARGIGLVRMGETTSMGEVTRYDLNEIKGL
jgi:hypothetical protein